jgi:hypothetical protein
VAAIPAAVIWSHLSRKPDASGKLLYESGLKIERSSTPTSNGLRRFTGFCGETPSVTTSTLSIASGAESKSANGSRRRRGPTSFPSRTRNPSLDQTR